MSILELKRVEVMKMIEAGRITGQQASELLKNSVRQVRRLIMNHREVGDAALARGNPSYQNFSNSCRDTQKPSQLNASLIKWYYAFLPISL